MRYAMLLKPHANVRYRQSLQKLALIELRCLLQPLGLGDVEPVIEQVAGESFIVFEAGEMSPQAWAMVSQHSSVCFAALWREDGAMLPLQRASVSYLPDDLPQVLKYKGKTNADFTYLMLHCAKAASAFAMETAPLHVLDPMCGKATTLFCALCEGHHAVGVDVDAKALQETDSYFERSLKLHRLKHKRTPNALTVGDGSVKAVDYAVAPPSQDLRGDAARTLRLINGDSAKLGRMLKPESVHLIVSDLPYGVQHAPHEGKGMATLPKLLARVLPGCVRVLKHGGAVAFSFNLNTLRRSDVEQAMTAAGLTVLAQPPYDDFSHWVEQAVDRDVVVACKP